MPHDHVARAWPIGARARLEQRADEVVEPLRVALAYAVARATRRYALLVGCPPQRAGGRERQAPNCVI